MHHLIGAGLYAVGGWLIVSHLLAVGPGPIDQPAPDAPPAFTCSCAQAAPRGAQAAGLKRLLITVADGPTYHCWVPAYVVADEAVVETDIDFVAVSRALDCS